MDRWERGRRKGRPVYVGEVGPRHVAAGLAEEACERIDPVPSLRSDAAFSDEEVEKRAGEGQYDDQEQPCEGHARRRPLHDDTNADDEHNQHVGQAGDGQEGGRSIPRRLQSQPAGRLLD